MRVLLASCLVFALSSFALTARAQDVRLDPELVELRATERPARAADEVRVSAEVLASLATLATGGLAGGFIGYATAAPCPDDAWLCFSPAFEVMFGTLVGLALASSVAPLVVAGVGHALGGRGDTGETYLGLLAGAAFAVLTVGLGVGMSDLAGSESRDAVLTGALIAGSALLIAGPVVGYEIGHRRAVRPGLALGPEGGSLTLAGSF